jgi:hypothetical protein
MRRLIVVGLLPERAGQPVKACVHVSLAELRAMDGDSALEGQWITAVRARWTAHRASASVGGGDGGAWLDGDAAQAVACDASLTPIVSGDVDIDALEDLVRLCVQLDRLGHESGRGEPGPTPVPDAPRAGPAAPVSPSRGALERAIIGKAADLLSGPGGLASFLRRQELGARLAGPSLPLDVGYSQNVPVAIRNAVIARDQHCRWAGGSVSTVFGVVPLRLFPDPRPAGSCCHSPGGRSSPRRAPVPAPPWSPGTAGRPGRAAPRLGLGLAQQLIGQLVIDQRPAGWLAAIRLTGHLRSVLHYVSVREPHSLRPIVRPRHLHSRCKTRPDGRTERCTRGGDGTTTCHMVEELLNWRRDC